MQDQPLAATAATTTRDNPWPLALLTKNVTAYINRMSPLWVSGQVVEYRRRPGTKMAFFVIRDHNENVSMTVKCYAGVIATHGEAFDEGASVVVHCKPDFYPGNGSLSLFAKQIELEGLGSLLARIERLREQLRSEGLFDEARKKPLPFLPRRVGLICGRNAKARHDVEVNARHRWPALGFEVREVAVQGPACCRDVVQAMKQLDAIDDVDVIVIARGGGSVEDLLPFSEEALVRAAAECATPLVSAIGHETDTPLLDLVVDYRASTPTDAARKIVPDVHDEARIIEQGRTRARQALTTRLERELAGLSDVRARPVMASPAAMLTPHYDGLAANRSRLTLAARGRIETERGRIDGMTRTLRALSPRSVMERGYALVRQPNRTIVTSVNDISRGDLIELVFADGTGVAQVAGTRPQHTREEGQDDE